MEKQTGFKSGKENMKAVYWHSAYLTYMQSTSFEMPGWMKPRLDEAQAGIKIAGRNISKIYLRYAVDTTLMVDREEELKSLLMTVKEDSKKGS